MKPSRKQIYMWRAGKALPKPKTIQKIKDEKLREEVALLAIKKYLPFVSEEKIKIKDEK
jgi:hypothetical protein